MVLLLNVLSEILAEGWEISHFNFRVYLYDAIRPVDPEKLENILDSVVKVGITWLDIKRYSIIDLIEKIRLVPYLNLIQVCQRLPI